MLYRDIYAGSAFKGFLTHNIYIFSFETQGLNFIVHADGAWGGYFCSMLREPAGEFEREVLETSGFVPELNMSEYVQKQLIGLARCDTIIIDPHKSGFCPYPAGAICYRDERMNNALAVTVQVSYYYGNVNLGDWGLEGSKPGAAAAGVLFANRVSLLCLISSLSVVT